MGAWCGSARERSGDGRGLATRRKQGAPPGRATRSPELSAVSEESGVGPRPLQVLHGEVLGRSRDQSFARGLLHARRIQLDLRDLLRGLQTAVRVAGRAVAVR